MQTVQIEWERLTNELNERLDALQRAHDLHDDIEQLHQHIELTFERVQLKFDEGNSVEQTKQFLSQIKVSRGNEW